MTTLLVSWFTLSKFAGSVAGLAISVASIAVDPRLNSWSSAREYLSSDFAGAIRIAIGYVIMLLLAIGLFAWGMADILMH
jgi:hypothetical protein